MRRAILVVIMGLGENPAGACLGLRAHVENLAQRYPLDLLFLSYKSTTAEIVAAIRALPPAPVILTGHSLGGGQAYEVAKVIGATALGIWEPVPEDDSFNGGYRFAPLPDIVNQVAVRVDGPFPIAWGREFSNDSLNIRIHPWKFTGLVANCHADICQRPEVLDWYEETVMAICDWDDLPAAVPQI